MEWTPRRKTMGRSTGGYVLWIGSFDPEHKDLDLLLQAIARLPSVRRPAVGLHGPDWRGRKQTRGAAQSNVQPGRRTDGPGRWARLPPPHPRGTLLGPSG